MRLVIFSSVPHYQHSQITAHAGFVHEIDLWASIFEEILVIALIGVGNAPADAIPYSFKNISFFWLDKTLSTDGVRGKLLLLLKYPFWIQKSLQVLSNEDVVMARGPDSVGFLGFITGKYLHLPHFAKYADQWKNFDDEPLGYRIQKMVYRSHFFGGPVQIYGSADAKHPHLVPFFTSSVTLTDWEYAKNVILQRKFELPFRLIFVGRLVRAKGVDLIVDAVRILHTDGYPVHLEIVGEGSELINLKNLVSDLGLSKLVTFNGQLDWSAIQERFAISHCFIHASRKEGFGKVLIEAMSYGLPIIGTDVGLSCEILSPPQYGFVVPPNSAEAIAEQVKLIMDNYSASVEVGERARQKARNYLLENVREQYVSFVKKCLGCNI